MNSENSKTSEPYTLLLNLIYLMDHVLYQIFKIILRYHQKNMKH